MTGRGLSLIAALAASWGVNPGGSGKVVWAEVPVPIEHTRTAEAPVIDRDAIRAAWPDDEAEDVPRYTVHLGAVPTELLLSAKTHIDNVVREMSLLGGTSASGGEPPSEAAARLIKTVTVDFAAARTEMKRQALEAAAEGRAITELELHLPAEAVEAAERYLAALNEADRYARSARLLTLAAPASHRVFRQWYVRSVVDQLRALTSGVTPVDAEPFTVALADEVDRLSQFEDAAERLDLLERVNSRLAGARTADDMASLVVGETARYPLVESARVYLPTDHSTMRSAAWHSMLHPPTEPYDEFSLDANLPGAEAIRSGQPMFLRDLRQVYDRVPPLEGYYPEERRLHVRPLIVDDVILGLLVVSMASSQLSEGPELELVAALSDALSQSLFRLRHSTPR
jgi:hypothetical protein